MPNSGDSPIRILYVDDEPGLLIIGKKHLEESGEFLVTGCESALDAIALLKKEHYDAIISDFQMPKCDGISFLKYLRKKGDETPFIILTGKGREEVVIEALNNGADFYLEKGGDLRAQFAELSNIVRYAASKKRSEEALRESEERYRNVVEDQTELICRFAADGRVIFTNDAYCRYFGIPCEEIVGSRFRPEIHPNDVAAVKHLISSLSPDNPHGSIDQRTIMPDGRILWQRWDTRAIFNENGSIREFQSVGRDITDLMERDLELKRANEEILASYEELTAIEEELRQHYDELKTTQEALQKSEGLQRLILQSLPDFLIRFDREGTYLDILNYQEDLLILPKDEVIGRRVTDVISGEIGVQMIQGVRSAIDRNELQILEYTLPVPAGICHFEARIVPYTENEVIALIRDITDKRKAEEAVIESEKRYRSLFETMHDGYALHRVCVDPNDGGAAIYVLDANPSFEMLIGGPRDKIVGKLLTEVIPDADPHLFEQIVHTAKTGESAVFEIRLNDPVRYVFVSVYSPGAGECATLFQDITEKKRRDEETKQSLREKEILLKEIHHRVKNNMQVISSLLMLQKETILDPEMRELFSQSESRVYSIALVHEKLYQSENLSRIEYGEYLSMMGDYVLSSRQVKAGTIALDIHARGIYLSIDKAVPLSLITNELMTNSLKHAFPNGMKGTITIRVEKKGNTIIYRFADDGIGFPPDIDYQNTTSLGMQLVTSLVNQLLGTITLTVEKGTTFEIVFPVDPEEDKRD